MFSVPRMPAIDDTITTAPPPRAAMPGWTRLQSQRFDFTFEPMILSKASSGSSPMVP